MRRDAFVAAARPATLCAFCPKLCRFACPVAEAEHNETVTPWGKMSLVHLGRTDQVDVRDPDVHRAFEACTGCGACSEQCAHGNPVAETLFFVRKAAESDRSRRFRRAFEATGDVKGRDLETPALRFKKSSSAKVAYFPGCTRLVDNNGGIDRDRRALQIAFGDEVPLAETPKGGSCCGYPLWADGQVDLVEDHLRKLWDALRGHRTLITPDPGCAYLLTVVRRSLDIPDDEGPDVLPLVEALATRAEAFTGASKGLAVRYHDPCYLGRRGRSFDAPRKLLRAATGRDIVEFAMCRDEADCSGGGGLYPMSNAEGAKAMARRRLSHDGNAHLDADCVVTACPTAKKTFDKAGVVAVDLTDVVLGEVDLSKTAGARTTSPEESEVAETAPIVFVVNPKSAGGATRRKFERFRPRLKAALDAFDVRLTEGMGHATALTREAIRGGAQVVCGVGGDGTNNEVLGGFFDEEVRPIETDCALSIMVSGTGGDFRRTLSWSTEPAEALERLLRREARPIDVGMAELTDHDGKTVLRPFLNIASFGLSGAVDEVVNKTPKTLGAKASFISGTLRAFARFAPQDVRLRLDEGEPFEQRISLSAVSNGGYFGGGMWIAPSADPFDGKLAFVTIGDVKKSFWLKNAHRVYSGSHIGLDGVTSAEGTSLHAEPVGNAEVLIDLDGEQPGRLPARFWVLPSAVKLLV